MATVWYRLPPSIFLKIMEALQSSWRNIFIYSYIRKFVYSFIYSYRTRHHRSTQTIALIQTALDEQPAQISKHNAQAVGNTHRTESKLTLRYWQILVYSQVPIHVHTPPEQPDVETHHQQQIIVPKVVRCDSVEKNQIYTLQQGHEPQHPHGCDPKCARRPRDEDADLIRPVAVCVEWVPRGLGVHGEADCRPNSAL